MTAKTPVGARVGALRNVEGDTVFAFGFGVYEGLFDPETGEKSEGIFGNPRIKLDDGRGYVWGFECWWGPEDAIKGRYAQYKVEYVTPNFNDDAPLKTVEESTTQE